MVSEEPRALAHRRDVYDVGVVVGRFQVPELHDAHRALIQTVCDAHDKVLVLLGVSPLRATTQNPLDFEARKQMILAAFPRANVLPIKDSASDHVWSRRLDEIVGDFLTPSQSAVIYGSRDSFLGHYHGRRPVQELVAERVVSGSEVRKAVSRHSTRASSDFRAGVVWAAFNRFPTCYPTVDVGVYDETGSRILLGQKADEEKWRLFGGFADPRSASYEADARREVEEEAGVAITDPQYMGSYVIDDWRYRGERDVIKTLLFRAKLLHGSPAAGDDIATVRWFVAAAIDLERDVMPAHRSLIAVLIGGRR